jgi:WD40 repeat protein
MKRIIFFLLSCSLLIACATQVSTDEMIEAKTPTPAPHPSTTPTPAFFNISNFYIPSATPTFIPVGKIVEELEIITPENIGRLELINRWGNGYLLELEISPDHSIIAVATSTGVYLHRASDLEQVGYLNVNPTDRHFMGIDFSPDSKFLAVAGYGASIWDIASQTKVGILPVDKPLSQPSIKFVPDGSHIIIEDLTYFCGAAGGNFALYNLEGYKVLDIQIQKHSLMK